VQLDPGEIQSVYEELERLASHLLRRERSGEVLHPNELVNEAYLRLHHASDSFRDRGHFLAVAARAMRRVLIDQARHRRALKRRHDLSFIDLDQATVQVEPDLDGFLAVDRALRRLDRADPELAQVIELRFFGGLSLEETAQALGISTRTLKRRWAEARLRLARELAKP
jgi:RNA polymerase sigma factor (TIGR02999 family)